MARILMLFSTVDGHTKAIAERLAIRLTEASCRVDVLPLSDAPASLDCYDRVVVGASIRYGKYRPELFQFIARNLEFLRQKPSAFFCVNLVARKPKKNAPTTNPYMRKFLASSPWKPALLGVFAGKLNYPIYSPTDRFIIRFIMWLTKGPTSLEAVKDYTDWQKVDDFASEILRL